MTREQYKSLQLVQLKELAKSRGLKHISGLKKDELIDRMLEEDAREAAEKETAAQEEEAPSVEKEKQEETFRPRQNTYTNRNYNRTQENTRTYSYGRNQENVRSFAPNRNRNQNNQDGGYGYSNNRNQNCQENNGYGYNRSQNQNTENNGSYGYNNNRNNQENNGYGNRSQYQENGGYNSRNQENRTENTYERNQDYSQERSGEDWQNEDRPAPDFGQLDSGQIACGILEVMPDGFGFIRSDNYMPGDNDVYVSPSQIRRFNLKTGDIISGNTRIKAPQEKFCALMYVQTVNDLLPFIASKRQNFENMTPIFPNERLRMEREGHHMAMRIVDLVSPVGKGQRGMIVSPPKAGKTTLLKEMAQSIVHNNPEMHIIILLIDERPEEVTDIRESIVGDNVEVIYSTFDEQPEHHKRVAEMVIERSKRLVEHNKDVTILLDSITRLARAYNMVVPPSGRTLSGGLDPGALHMPKKFFGAARNMREGGSLTILATALVDTGSKMDDVIYEEFKGTGNMELILDRKLSEKRVFPAIDIVRSGTRREDLLLTAEEKEAVDIMRKQLNGMKPEDAVENILNTFAKTKSNEEFIQIVRKQKFI
ncbi:transcription termination factor Rho [Fusicatenibacter faecihominis]|uniref:Transcription termination factor Rho n=1 Tax=Fusicatenibacter faecihominis TaxID=2881276 RepID=A0AAE3DRK8_9FIRM|nr:transcription termination factor Rho [Fusicatenibacter faecihominis]MCC2189143.1 transcription termination factor Rho [Fusicatenibacter faecihominis]